MCEASSNHPFREARRGDITKVGSVPGYDMKGLFEDGKPIGEGPASTRALLVCANRGAVLFIERIKFILSSRMHNSEFANAEDIECAFHTDNYEFRPHDGFVMKNGVLIPLSEIENGTRVRIAMPFVAA